MHRTPLALIIMQFISLYLPARLLLFFLFAGGQSVLFPLSAQNKTIDSLLTHLKKDKEDTNKVIHANKLCVEYKDISSYDTALRYGNIALQLAEQLNFSKGAATAYNNIGIIYWNKGNYTKALENYFAALKIGKEADDKQSIADAYNHIGIIYYEQGNYAKALENYFASLKMKERMGNKHGLAASYNNIGNIYYEQGNYDKALEHQLASLKIREETGDKPKIAASYNNIGNIYCEQGNYDKALENHFTSLKIHKENGHKELMATSYNNIGEIYFRQGNLSMQRGHTTQAGREYDKALENQFTSLKIYKEIGHQEGISTAYLNIGNTYMAKNKYADAITHLLNSLQLSKELGVKDGMMEAYRKLSEVQEKMNDYKSAHTYYQLYSQLKDSIFNEQSSKQMAELQTQYETEKKDKEIQFQELKLSEQELLLNRNKTLLFVIIIFSLLFIAFGWTAFSRYRIKQQMQLKSEILRQQELRTNAIIETQEQERKRIAQDLHDGIGHKLTTLKINFEKITGDIHATSPEQRMVFKQTENILDETHKEVRTLSHVMMPKALQERELADAVSDLLEQTFANSKIKYLLKNDLPPQLPENIQVCLYRVLQELLNNTLKHAQATEIVVQIYKSRDNAIMMVEDNGEGIKQNMSPDPNGGKGKNQNYPEGRNTQSPFRDLGQGIGLHNIAGRIHALKGIFTIEPGPIKGTIATVRIPLPRP